MILYLYVLPFYDHKLFFTVRRVDKCKMHFVRKSFLAGNYFVIQEIFSCSKNIFSNDENVSQKKQTRQFSHADNKIQIFLDLRTYFSDQERFSKYVFAAQQFFSARINTCSDKA